MEAALIPIGVFILVVVLALLFQLGREESDQTSEAAGAPTMPRRLRYFGIPSARKADSLTLCSHE